MVETPQLERNSQAFAPEARDTPEFPEILEGTNQAKLLAQELWLNASHIFAKGRGCGHCVKMLRECRAVKGRPRCAMCVAKCVSVASCGIQEVIGPKPGGPWSSAALAGFDKSTRSHDKYQNTYSTNGRPLEHDRASSSSFKSQSTSSSVETTSVHEDSVLPARELKTDEQVPLWCSGSTGHDRQARRIWLNPAHVYPLGGGCQPCIKKGFEYRSHNEYLKCAYCTARPYTAAQCGLFPSLRGAGHSEENLEITVTPFDPATASSAGRSSKLAPMPYWL